MTTILQIEHRATLLSTREEILQFLGHPILSVLGSKAAKALDLSGRRVGVVVIGHSAPWRDRLGLVAHFKDVLPMVPIVVLLRRTDCSITKADYNCPADNPPKWVRAVNSALSGIA